jgi:hypothetical protein
MVLVQAYLQEILVQQCQRQAIEVNDQQFQILLLTNKGRIDLYKARDPPTTQIGHKHHKPKHLNQHIPQSLAEI